MSEPSPSLLIDVGNSRIKWTLCAPGESLGEIKACESPTELSAPIAAASKVILAAVGQSDNVTQIRELCENQQRTFQQVFTQASQFGVQCAYQNYSTLGVDRWLAVLAARHLSDKPALCVIDAGTAATCDFVLDNQHQGGWIMPGFAMMRESLVGNTEQVFGDTHYPTQLDVGESTPECVSLGCLAALQGMVQQAHLILQRQGHAYDIFVTGGNQHQLVEMPIDGMHAVSNLVLHGLNLFNR